MTATTATGASRLVLRNARLPDALAGKPTSGAVPRVDITIAGGLVTAIEPSPKDGADRPAEAGADIHDMRDGLVLPAFVDIHTHLDKGHIWPRKPNPDGTWMNALLSVAEDRERHWSASDVERRMEFSLAAAYAHGTAAIRTHLDSAPPQHGITWDVFEKVRERWADRIELQGVSLLGPDHLLDKAIVTEVARRTKAGKGVMGGAIADHPETRQATRNVVEAAGEAGLDLDIHCDETGNPDASALYWLADAVIELGYTGRVAAGHCCALAVQDETTFNKTVERVAKAGVAVISLPMCNMYLQDRGESGARKTPRWRGVAPLRELAEAGVPVAIASDNTRDPFYAYGDLDGIEVLREGARILHFDHPADEAWAWTQSMGAWPARFAGMATRAEVVVGAPADLVLLSARSWSEMMARPQADRKIMRAGRIIDAKLPDYRDLDDLMGDTSWT
jgi:cytosine/creatinine deaminase